MSEYDIALDCQVDWASFWSSDAGRDFFHQLGVAVSKQRQGKGEKQFKAMVDYETDEIQLVLMPIINGECYYWSAEMLDIVKSASKSLPDSWALTIQHIPAVSGFFYFAKELERGERAFAWSALSVDLNDPHHAAVLYIHDKVGPIPDFNTVALTTFVRNPNPRFTRPLPCRATIMVGESLRDWKESAVREAAKINADVKEFSDNYESLRLFGAMLSFIQQRILVSSRWDVSRATRKRVERYHSQTEPTINVIRLRSVSHRPHEGKGEQVDWACRWIVRGHWREQWYSSLGKHQPVFISPYIKGPGNKLLRDPKRLFAVVR